MINSMLPGSPEGLCLWSASTSLSASSRTWAIHFVTRLVETLQKAKQKRHRINQRILSSTETITTVGGIGKDLLRTIVIIGALSVFLCSAEVP